MSGFKCLTVILGCLAAATLADDSRLFSSTGSAPEPETAESTVHRTRSLPEHDDEVFAGRNWTTISEMLDVYSSRHLAEKWEEGKYPVGTECDRDIARFVEGLRKHEMWALKGD